MAEKSESRRAPLHPDLALLDIGAAGPLCCLALEDAGDAPQDGLGLSVLHAYRHGAQHAFLFETPRQADWTAALETRLREKGLCAGLSGPFALAASAHGCLRKARLALETGRRIAPSRALYPMDEFGEAALLAAAQDALSREGLRTEDFCCGAVMQMEETDAAAGTQYAASLHAYLRCGMDAKRAAQALGVHRNTLAYRMRRAEELFALDLSDVNACFELLFALWLRENLPDGGADAPQTDGRAEAFDAGAAQALLWRHMEQKRARRDARPAAGFACRMLCVGVSRLADAERTALIGRLRAALPENGACAFDEDTVLLVLAPQDMPAYAERARGLCGNCRTVLTGAFAAGRTGCMARLCRMALCVPAVQHAQLQEMGSTLFFMMLERHTPLAPYLCEDVIRVMDDDAMRGAALSKALYAYLLHFCDMKRAAAQLGVHRNTMEYQMKKISAIIGGRPDEGKRFRMMCTFRMLALPDAPYLRMM